ncbi:hypothetical protein MASR2M15_21620 [Anaerolineales bacterium]
MSRRRIFAWFFVVISASLTLAGFIIFVLGVLVEFLGGSDEIPSVSELSPFMQLAMAGLCLSAAMMIFTFVLVGILIARQTRKQGAGYGDAYRLIQNYQYDAAIPLLERSLQSGHETADLLVLLTNAYAFSGRYAKALATADHSIQVFPDDARSYLALATCYLVQASYDESATALQRSLELDPRQGVVWAELGFIYHMIDQEAESYHAYQQAIRYPMPEMYLVRVAYHLVEIYKSRDETAKAIKATAQMMSARNGLKDWYSVVSSLAGTVYGIALKREIEAIEQGFAETLKQE